MTVAAPGVVRSPLPFSSHISQSTKWSPSWTYFLVTVPLQARLSPGTSIPLYWHDSFLRVPCSPIQSVTSWARKALLRAPCSMGPGRSVALGEVLVVVYLVEVPRSARVLHKLSGGGVFSPGTVCLRPPARLPKRPVHPSLLPPSSTRCWYYAESPLSRRTGWCRSPRTP